MPMRSKELIHPPRLRAGGRVAIIAPAGPLSERDDLSRAAELCRALQWEPVPGRNALHRHGYLAGTDPERLADLNRALTDPTIDAVWCVRGGYGVTRILDGVDFAGFARRPRPVIGFSDVTALLLALHRAGNVVSFHGPMGRAPLTTFSRDHLLRVVTRAEPAGRLGGLSAPGGVLIPRSPRVVSLTPGTAEGPLLGGNLSVLMALAGTRHFPDLNGAILFLEDVGEDLYRVDRMLSQLRMLGLLDQLAGVAIGQFTDMKRATTEGALAFDEVLLTYFGPSGIPVAMGFPFGHVDEQWSLPLGVRARLDAGQGTLELLEAAVS
jgi:muramoyltetrapeptide carboxypeptidase